MFETILGKKVNYSKKGSGEESVVFVHGWGGNLKSFEAVQNKFPDSINTLSFDLPGFGKSSSPNQDWGTQEYAEFVKKFIEKMSLKNVTYVGHSFGGSIGIFLASKYPEFFKNLVLISPSYKRPQPIESDKPETFFRKVSRIRLIKLIYYRLFFPNSDLPKYPKLETNFRKIVKFDMTHLTTKIKANTLIVWGNLDKDTPVSDAYLLHENIKGSKIKIFDGLGHGIPRRRPELVYKEIKKFLRL